MASKHKLILRGTEAALAGLVVLTVVHSPLWLLTLIPVWTVGAVWADSHKRYGEE